MFSVEAGNKETQAERSGASLLSVLLDHLADVASHEFDRGLVFVIKSVRLSLDSGVVHENSSVRVQSRKSSANVLVNLVDLLDGTRVLELLEGFLLYGNDDSIFAFDGRRALTLKSKMFTMLIASIEYSTWRRFPFGEKIVIALS